MAKNVSDRTDITLDQVFLGVGPQNGGSLFFSDGRKVTRLEDESPAYRKIMETCTSARHARREAGKSS